MPSTGDMQKGADEGAQKVEELSSKLEALKAESGRAAAEQARKLARVARDDAPGQDLAERQDQAAGARSAAKKPAVSPASC